MSGADANANANDEPITVILGVSGSIAAYKAAEIASALHQRGLAVHVVMTEAATKLITPATFYPLTGNPVHSDLWDPEATRGGARVEHVGLAERAHVLAIAPATANVIGKIANGLADDFLTTMALAFPGPLLWAPAMNDNMYRHPAVQRNLAALRAMGHRFVDPDQGALACGRHGIGRLAAPLAIADAIEALGREEQAARAALRQAGARGPVGEQLARLRRSLRDKGIELGAPIARAAGAARGARDDGAGADGVGGADDGAAALAGFERAERERRAAATLGALERELAGGGPREAAREPGGAPRALRVLVTAGPTREPLDAVRVLTNPSSGRMGDAIAARLAARGHAVTLVRGPVDRPPPAGIPTVPVTTTEEMRAACVLAFARCDAVVMAAAPSDFRPVERSPGKLKKREIGDEALALKLEPTPDILRELGASKRPEQRLIGFALESADGLANALAKLREKRLDLVVLNGPANLGAARGEAILVDAGGERARLAGTKDELADAIVRALEGLFAAEGAPRRGPASPSPGAPEPARAAAAEGAP